MNAEKTSASVRSEAPHGAAITERSAEFAGYRTRVLEVQGSGPAFLLIHGWTDSADTWRPVLRRLAHRGRAAVAVDLPGHAHADMLDRDHPALPQLVAFATSVAQSLDMPVLVGNSLGGCTALLTAEQADVVSGVVPVGPAGVRHDPWMWALGSRLRERPGWIPRTRNGLVSHRVRSRVLGGGAALAGRVSLGVHPHFFTYYGSHMARREIRQSVFALARKLIDEVREPPFEFAKIECPVMLVWGDRDRLASPKGAAVIRQALPDVRVESLRGVGHVPQLQCPDVLVDLLCDFAPVTPLR